MILNKIKQNLAGFAVVALAFTGLSAVAPANAIASNLADTGQLGFDYTQQFAMTGSNGTLTVPYAPSGHIEFNSVWTLTAAGSASLNGAAITADVTATDPNGNIVWSSRGFNRQFSSYASVPNSNNTLTWNISSATTIYNIWYTNGSAPMPIGNYTISSVLKKDGVAIVPSSDISFSANMRYNIVSDTMTWSGTAPSMWRSGYVCVDMALVNNGDVLNASMTENGAPFSGNPHFDWTSNGYTPLASAASYTVATANISNSTLAVMVDTMGGLTSGSVYGVSIKRGATEVSKSCAPAAPSTAPAVSASSTPNSLTLTGTVQPVAGSQSYICYAYDANNTLVGYPGSVPSSSSTCSVSIYGSSFSSSYTMRYAGQGLITGSLSPTSAAISPFVATFDANGGTGSVPSSITHWGNFNAPSGVSLTRTGYSFSGWSTNAAATSTSIYVGTPVSASSNATYYAVWTAVGMPPQQPQLQNTTVTASPILSGSPTAGATVNVAPTQFSGITTTQKYWVSCSAAQSQAAIGPSNFGMQNASGPLATLMGNCYPIYASNSNPNPNAMTTASSFTIPSDGMVWRRVNSVYSQVSLDGRYLGWIETQNIPNADGAGITFATAFGTATPSVLTPPPTAMPTQVPILQPIAGVSQGVRAGGTLVLETANGATITEVKVADQTATLSKVEKGVEILVPTGLTPGAKDLLIKTSTGSTLHVGAIKIADPVLEAQKLAMAKAAASVSFRAPLQLKVAGNAISSNQAAQVRNLVKDYRGAKEVVCVAVPATKASAASARQAAAKACATFKAANRNLKVTIIVEAPSGEAANVVSTELIG